MRARPRSSRTEGALRCRPCRAGPPSPDWWLGSEAENDREGGTRATAVAREEAPRVLAGRGHLEEPAQERVAVRRGRPLELHPLAHGGQVGAAHAGGGAARGPPAGGGAEPVPAGAATGGSRRRGCDGRGNGHGRVLPLSAGKSAEADVRCCYSCDWCDAPGGMDARYLSVTSAERTATLRACCASGSRAGSDPARAPCRRCWPDEVP